MMDFFFTYQSLFDHILVYALLAMSQYVVLRAGVFSLGTAGFAALGAYATALLITKSGWPPARCDRRRHIARHGQQRAAGATAVAAARRVPGGRDAGAGSDRVVGHPELGQPDEWRARRERHPKVASTGILLAVVVVVVLFLVAMGRYGVGRAMDVIREDETVAVSLGISVPHYHRIAFIISGTLAGLAGALQATSSYAISPNEFGFSMLVAALTMVVLGGRTTVWGALVGAVILTSLPELFRVFADYRNVVQGILLMLVIIYLPRGVADTLLSLLRDRRLRRTPVTAAPQPASAAFAGSAMKEPVHASLEVGAHS